MLYMQCVQTIKMGKLNLVLNFLNSLMFSSWLLIFFDKIKKFCDWSIAGSRGEMWQDVERR